MATTDAQTLKLRPPIANLQWYKGSALPFNIVGQDSAGAFIDITGATVKIELKDPAGTVALTLETGGAGIVLTDPTNGKMTVSPEVVGTTGMSVDIVYEYDVKVTLADASITPWVRGTVTFETKITS